MLFIYVLPQHLILKLQLKRNDLNIIEKLRTQNHDKVNYNEPRCPAKLVHIVIKLYVLSHSAALFPSSISQNKRLT